MESEEEDIENEESMDSDEEEDEAEEGDDNEDEDMDDSMELEEKEATVDVIEEGTLTIEKFRAFVACITRSGEALARYPAIEAILVTDTSRGEEVLRAAEQYVRGR